MDSGVRRLMSIPEARATLGGIGHTKVYQLINRGEIVKVSIGRRAFITSESLEAYMDRLSKASMAGGRGVMTARLHVDQQTRDRLDDHIVCDYDQIDSGNPVAFHTEDGVVTANRNRPGGEAEETNKPGSRASCDHRCGGDSGTS